MKRATLIFIFTLFTIALMVRRRIRLCERIIFIMRKIS